MYNTYLAHFGIKGQKWGVRRFQNEDGSYKSNAKGRYDEKKVKYKDIKRDKQAIFNKEYAKASVIEKKKDAERIAKLKNKNTKSSLNKAAELEADFEWVDRAQSKAYNNTGKALVQKYGQQRMDQFNAQSDRRFNAKVYGAIGAFAALSVASIVHIASK